MVVGKNGGVTHQKDFKQDCIDVELFGKCFQFKPDNSLDDPGEVVNKLKEYVARAEKTVGSNPSAQNRFVILLLAGMNMAKDLTALESKSLEIQEYLNTKTSDLLTKLNDFACNMDAEPRK